MSRYCIHGASIETSESSRKIVLTIGPLGVLSAHGTDFPSHDDPERHPNANSSRKKGILSSWRREGSAQGSQFSGQRGDFVHYYEGRDATLASPTTKDSRPRKLVLVADSVEEFRLWVLLISRGKSRSISRFFDLEMVVGNGAAGDVFRAKSVDPAYGQVAVKRIEYNNAQKNNAARKLRRIQKEIQTQVKAASRSPNVVKLIDVFFDSRYAYLVMELIEGGSLREWLDKHGTVEEPVAISIAQQITRCLLTLHQHRIVHRDIKTDNILLKLDRNESIRGVQLTDFGFAEVCRSGDMDTFCTTFLGTASYMATEIASFRTYGAPVDMYALGVLVCVMIAGVYPFDEPTGLLATLERIKAAESNRIRDCHSLSGDAKSFCLALTNPSPQKRLSPTAALQHRWLRRGKNVAEGVLKSADFDRTPRSWFRRIFHVLSASLALQRWAKEPPPPQPYVDPATAKARHNMLRRLDREMQMKQPVVHRPSHANDAAQAGGEDDGEVFVGDESSRLLPRFRHPQHAGATAELQ